MENLSANWFVEGLQDFEYKKYLLLAYLKTVKEEFDQSRLYPSFSELIRHYHNLLTFQEQQEQFRKSLPKDLVGIDPEELKLLRKSLLEDDKTLREVEEIVQFSIPKIRGKVDEGKELYELIEENIEIETVGILPLYKSEGYLLLQMARNAPIKAFAYQMTVFENANERYRGLHTVPVTTFEYSITNTFETIKQDLVKSRPDLPNPATFYVFSRLTLPEQEAVIPVTKRKFMQHLAKIEG